MTLFFDLFDYLALILRAFALIAQTVTLGSVAFLCLIAQRLQADGIAGADTVQRGAVRILRIAGSAIAVFALLRVALQVAGLVGTGIPLDRALGAGSVIAWSLQAACGAALAVRARRVDASTLVFALAVLACGIATSHAAGRIEDRGWLLAATVLHQAGAAVWIGGLPALLVALATVTDRRALAFVGRRYSAMALAGVVALLTGAGFFAVKYIGSGAAMYGTAYGFMTGAKVALFLMLAFLGAGNFFLVRRLNRDPATPIFRFRRFVEAELGLALAALAAAASLTSVPPAVDLTADRVTWEEIAERNWPPRPAWTSPAHDQLAISKLRDELESRGADERALAFVPGSGVRVTYNEADKLWSQFNHNWAGVFLLIGALLALGTHAGLRWARNWPLVFIGLAVFLFLRSDADAWPAGDIGFWESFRDPEILQHRALLPLIVAIGWFERNVQTGRYDVRPSGYVFPLLCLLGGLVLLTHSHTLDDTREVLLIEMSHSIMALLALATGAARWLELRSEDLGVRRVAAWIWPIGLALIGVVLIGYREM
ncbi:MAG TPA: CopD family protein [Burkholderiales bacterium]|nr:CopD family protein [Burkholderiales bacterium]